MDSPSNSLEVVSSNNKGSCENTTPSVPSSYCFNPNNVTNKTSAWDSDSDTELDPSDGSTSVPPDVLKNLSEIEKKRQEVINGN